MDRRVEPEFLDELLADDPRALQSRRDLQRLNRWMGNSQIMARALQSCFSGHRARYVAELGAGDGIFMLRVAERLAGNGGPAKPTITVTLLDKQNIIRPETEKALQALGWRAELVQADVFDWLRQSSPEPCDGIFANLFLHHFSDAQLAALFDYAARRARFFVAVEPRRWLWSVWFGRLLWLIGCNEVTRHDARVSIRAGFTGRELSQLWPADENWSLLEEPANLASHLFIANRQDQK